MRDTSPFCSESALAHDALVTTDSGLVYMSDIATPDMHEGDVIDVDVNLVTPDGGIIHADRLVCCGNRTAYTVRLDNGQRSTTTWNNRIETGRANDGRGLTPIEHLDRDDTIVVPIVPHVPCGHYDGRMDWSAKMMADGALPPQVLCGRRGYIDVFMHSMLESKYSMIDVAPRTTLLVSSDNDVTLVHHAMTKRILDQLQMMLLAYYGVVTSADYSTNIMRISNEMLARLERRIRVIDDVCEDNGIDAANVRWLLGVYDGRVPSKPSSAYIGINDIEGNGRRDMYAFVLPQSARFISNGTIHCGALHDYPVNVDENGSRIGNAGEARAGGADA